MLYSRMNVIYKRIDALAWLQDQAKQACIGSNGKRLADCALQFAENAMGALNTDLVNFLTIDKIAPLANGGQLIGAVQAIFDAGRAITQLAPVP